MRAARRYGKIYSISNGSECKLCTNIQTGRFPPEFKHSTQDHETSHSPQRKLSYTQKKNCLHSYLLNDVEISHERVHAEGENVATRDATALPQQVASMLSMSAKERNRLSPVDAHEKTCHGVKKTGHGGGVCRNLEWPGSENGTKC